MGEPIPVVSPIDVSIFVACYNEEQNIVTTLETIAEAMRQAACTFEVILIDDGSSDASVRVVEEFWRQHPEYPLTLIRNLVNRGLAFNFVEAAFLARGEYYKLVCGDAAEPLECMVPILKARGQADIIVPYPFVVENKRLGRVILSKLYTLIVNLLSGFPLKYWNGCGLFRRTDVLRWHSNTAGFGFQADLVSQLLFEGRSYLEIGNTYRERRSGESKALKFQNICSVAHSLVTIFARRIRRLLFEKRTAGLERMVKTAPSGQETRQVVPPRRP